MEKINLLGKGFIGSRFTELYPNVIVNERNDYQVKTNNVLYFISTTDNYSVITDPYIDITTNLLTLIKTLESCKNKDITFNFISSWFVYGQIALPATENSICEPRGFYSITKRAAEQLLISYCELFNLKYRILRLGNVVGETDVKVSERKNALQYVIKKLKSFDDVALLDNGDFFRDFIYVDDVVRAISLVIHKGDYNSIYNIGNGYGTKFKDLIIYAKEKLNSKSKIKNYQLTETQRHLHIKSNYLDISKITSLGYVPMYSGFQVVDRLL